MEHCWHIVATAVMCIIGTTIMIATLNPGARYFGMFLMCAGPFVGLNVSGSKTFVFAKIHLTLAADSHSLGDDQRRSSSHKTWGSGRKCLGRTCTSYLRLVSSSWLFVHPIRTG